MTLEERYPKLFEKLEDKDIELRHLISIDENYEDYDSDEFEFDFEEYNYIVYLSAMTQKALGEEKLKLLGNKLESLNEFENFLISEDDLYALKSDKSIEELEDMLLQHIEDIL